MADIEKVIKAWKIFRNSNPYQICDGREFRVICEPEYCMGQMIADTIELLKEYKAIKETISDEIHETAKMFRREGERHHNRIHRKYVKLRPTIKDCTCGGLVGMNEAIGRKIKRFYIECEDCHWCSKSMPTIRMAIRSWNKDMSNHEKWYSEHIGDC